MATSASKSTAPNRSTIWIGNLDPRVNEFQLLKVVEPWGRVVRFDLMYAVKESGYRTPRGYAFVTFESYLTASEAITKLNGLKLMDRELKVQPSSATNIPSKSSSSSLKSGLNLPLSLSMNLTDSSGKKDAKSASKLGKIRAMEAKLMALKQEEDFRLQVPTTPNSKNAISSSSAHLKKPYDRPK